MGDEIERLKRFIAICLLIILMLVGGLLFWGSYQLKNTTSIVAGINTKFAQYINQPQEQIEKTVPVPGPRGDDGTDSVSTHTVVEKTTTVMQDTLFQQNVPVPGPRGDDGTRGPQGLPGREIELGKLDGEVVWRYVGDKAWQELTEVKL